MTLVKGLIDLSGYHVWWVITDDNLIPFQGEYAESKAQEYMKVVS